MTQLHIMSLQSFPVSFILCSLFSIGSSQITDKCVEDITQAVDEFLHTEYPRIKLPPRTVLGFVQLYDGFLDTLEDIKWNSTLLSEDTSSRRSAMRKRQRSTSADVIRVKASAIVSKITAKYKCSISGFVSWLSSANENSCAPAPVVLSDLHVDLDIDHSSKTGQIRVSNVQITDGNYEIKGILMGRPIDYTGSVPKEMRERFAKFIEDTADRSDITLNSLDCLHTF